ncbi:MAG: hypothetical protein ACOC89_01830 [Candidatus Saliniplasma sp.]
MEEDVCSIEITKSNDILKAKVQLNNGRYEEYQNENMEYLLEMVYDDIQMEVREDYW